MPHFPALNEITRQALDYDPEYPENADERMYMLLFPEDYDEHGVDMAGNVALLLDKEQAVEVRDLAEEIIEQLEENESDSNE